MDGLDGLREGVVGEFLEDDDDRQQWLPGHAVLGDDGLVRVHLARPPGMPVRDIALPSALRARTTAGGLLLTDVEHSQHFVRSGSPFIDSQRLRARTVFAGVSPDDIASVRVKALSARFVGVSAWEGVTPIEVEYGSGANGRLERANLRLSLGTSRTAELGDGVTLTLRRHWRVAGEPDARTVKAPLEVTVASAEPTGIQLLRRPLQSVQGLISLAYGGLAVAESGSADLDWRVGPPLDHPEWHAAALMEVPPGGASLPAKEVPVFTLATIGGVDGIGEWCRLERQHARAVGPLIAPLRYGSGYVETRLMEIAAAIEYWVAAHRRGSSWAKKSPEHPTPASSLACRVGEPFADFVGNPAAWAVEFSDTHNVLKHEPNRSRDGYRVHLLATSGALLLQCALLNDVADSADPAREVLASHRHQLLSEQLRDHLA